VIGVTTVGGLAALVDHSISAADAIGKTADKIGAGVEALQELRFAAKASGVEASGPELDNGDLLPIVQPVALDGHRHVVSVEPHRYVEFEVGSDLDAERRRYPDPLVVRYRMDDDLGR
jgi:hypothetical protein